LASANCRALPEFFKRGARRARYSCRRPRTEPVPIADQPGTRTPFCPVPLPSPFPLLPSPFSLPRMPYLATLLQRSRRLFLALVKVMLPVMIAVRLGQEAGLVDMIGRAIAPAMGWLGLPPEAGMIWVT